MGDLRLLIQILWYCLEWEWNDFRASLLVWRFMSFKSVFGIFLLMIGSRCMLVVWIVVIGCTFGGLILSIGDSELAVSPLTWKRRFRWKLWLGGAAYATILHYSTVLLLPRCHKEHWWPCDCMGGNFLLKSLLALMISHIFFFFFFL